MTIYDGRESFYQWDLNQKVTSDDFQVGDKIHFHSMRHPLALATKAYLLEGKVVADVPNILLQTTNPIRIYRYISDSTSAQTVDEQTFVVKQKPQPPDYFYTETELYELRADVERATEEAYQATSRLQEGLDNAITALELATQAERTSTENEQARVTAEEQRKSAETARKSAETKRSNAEITREDAEALRVEAENERLSAEETRSQSETTRITAETERVNAETARKTAETQRVGAESKRESNELARTTAETARSTAETNRGSAETLRAQAETQRVTTESNRVTSEQDRVDAEVARQTAEQERQSAETLRQTTFEQSYNNVSNALKGSVSGVVIRVDDVSPIEHRVRAKVRGKNLIDLNNPVRVSYFNYSVEDNKLILQRTNTQEIYSNLYYRIGDYADFGGKTITCSVTNENNSSFVFYVGLMEGMSWGEGIKGFTVVPNTTVSYVIPLPKKTTDLPLCFRICSSDKAIDLDSKFVISNIQIELGDTATEYEPYIDPTTVTVTRCGKNILPYPYADTTLTRQGITFTDNGNGSITAKGTATGVSYFGLSTKLNLGEKAITPQANGCGYKVSENLYYNPSNGVTSLNFSTGEVVDKTFYPMVVVGDTLSEYEHHNGETYIPAADGTCEIVSVSPTMTLLTDTAGVTIEAEYNRDSNIVINELQLKINELETLIKSHITV